MLRQTDVYKRQGNKRSNYEIKTEESGKSILSVTFNKEMRRFVINSEAFMDGLKQFTGYTHIRFEITNTSEDYQDGLNVMLTAGAANIPLGYAGDFAPGETRLVTYDLPDILINENAPRRCV